MQRGLDCYSPERRENPFHAARGHRLSPRSHPQQGISSVRSATPRLAASLPLSSHDYRSDARVVVHGRCQMTAPETCVKVLEATTIPDYWDAPESSHIKPATNGRKRYIRGQSTKYYTLVIQYRPGVHLCATKDEAGESDKMPQTRRSGQDRVAWSEPIAMLEGGL